MTPSIIPAPPGKSYLPYQLKGIRYALGARGTLIADSMGLGKTIQAIGVINASLTSGLVVIVCPAGLKLNWRNELAAWLVPKVEVLVLSYHEANKFHEHFAAEMDILIIDEGHYIKNPQSQRSQLMLALAQQAKRVLILTGTPMENRPVELWPLLKILCPEKWDPGRTRVGTISKEQLKTHPGEGPNFWAFCARYCDLKKTKFRKGRYWQTALDYSGASNLEELRKKLRATCMVRRLKEDVLPDLPPKRRQIIVLPSDGVDDSGYLSDMTFENYETTLSRLTADKVAFADFSKRRHEQALKKVDACLRFIGDALDEVQKIIVFAHHSDVIEKLASGITAEMGGADYAVTVTGATHVADRGAAVKAFQEDEKCRVFIGSIGAAGVGITLTAASLVVFCELDPVPGKMSQAEDRAHRIGQKGMVLVQHLVYDKSICARMCQIMVRKQAVIKEALDG